MIIVKITKCSRCGGVHENIEAKPFSDNTVYTHFAWCPNTNEPILVKSYDVDTDDNPLDQKLDRFHYHEFLERAHLLGSIVETICDHPVKDKNKDIEEQVDKILMECAELYQLTGQKDEAWEESEVMPDIRNKLTPMLTLASLLESAEFADERVKKIAEDTIKIVKQNVEYLSNLKL